MKELTKEMLAENGYNTTNDITQAIYILKDGSLFDGAFDYGRRGVDHREMEAFSKYDRYDGTDFWDDVTKEYGLILLVPENKQVLTIPDFEYTTEQKLQIEKALSLGYEIMDFK